MVSEKDKAQITMMYRQAADKRSQIKILSELYLISQKEVFEILKEAGYHSTDIDGVLKRKIVRGKLWTTDELERARSLWLSGMNYSQIAAAMGRSVDSVRVKLTAMVW